MDWKEAKRRMDNGHFIVQRDLKPLPLTFNNVDSYRLEDIKKFRDVVEFAGHMLHCKLEYQPYFVENGND